MEAVLKDIGADVLKNRMLGDKALVETIAEAFEDLAAGVPRDRSGDGGEFGRQPAAEGRRRCGAA
jgi:hypothetical protein